MEAPAEAEPAPAAVEEPAPPAEPAAEPAPEEPAPAPAAEAPAEPEPVEPEPAPAPAPEPEPEPTPAPPPPAAEPPAPQAEATPAPAAPEESYHVVATTEDGGATEFSVAAKAGIEAAEAAGLPPPSAGTVLSSRSGFSMHSSLEGKTFKTKTGECSRLGYDLIHGTRHNLDTFSTVMLSSCRAAAQLRNPGGAVPVRAAAS